MERMLTGGTCVVAGLGLLLLVGQLFREPSSHPPSAVVRQHEPLPFDANLAAEEINALRATRGSVLEGTSMSADEEPTAVTAEMVRELQQR